MKRLKYLLLLLIVLVACGSLPVYGETDAPAPSLEAGQPVGGVVEITDGGATLRADASSGKIWVADPFGGEWASNPDDPEADPVASGFLKMNLYAQLIVSYIGDNGATDTTNNYVSAIRSGGILCERLENGVRFTFTFEKEGFVIPVEYRLADGRLIADIPLAHVQENGGAHLTEIQLLPFFGALAPEEDGYLLVPDGCGALIRTGATRDEARQMSKYTGYVYGRDPILSTTLVSTHTEAVTLPMFGVRRAGSGFLAVIEQGDALSKLIAVPNNKETSLAAVSPSVVFRNSDFATLREMKADEKRVLTYTQTPVSLANYRVSYRFLPADEADYAGMAAAAREYLKEQGMDGTAAYAGLVLELTAGVRTADLLLGIPVEKYQPLTTFRQTEQIITELRQAGIGPMRIKLDSWQAGGMFGKTPTGGKADGGAADGVSLKALYDFAAENGAALFPTVDLLRIYRSGGGLSRSGDAVRSVSGGIFTDARYLRSTYRKDPDGLTWTLAKFSSFAQAAARYSRSMDRQGIANFADLSSGNLLPSDGHHSSFGGQMPTDRQQALQAYQTVYEELAADRQMLFDNGYGYTFPYATDLTGLPVASSGYALFDEDIPFVQLAVHGSFVYTAPAINLSADAHAQLLKSVEYGCVPLYSLAMQDTERLAESALSERYSVRYDYWKETLQQDIAALQPLLQATAGREMVSHRRADGGVYVTAYAGGVYTAVNYTQAEASVDGHTVPAGGWTYWQAEGGNAA